MYINRPTHHYFVLSPSTISTSRWINKNTHERITCLSFFLLLKTSYNTFMEAVLRVYQTVQTSKNFNMNSHGSLAEVRWPPTSKSERDRNRCFCEKRRSMETAPAAFPWTRYTASLLKYRSPFLRRHSLSLTHYLKTSLPRNHETLRSCAAWRQLQIHQTKTTCLPVRASNSCNFYSTIWLKVATASLHGVCRLLRNKTDATSVT